MVEDNKTCQALRVVRSGNPAVQAPVVVLSRCRRLH